MTSSPFPFAFVFAAHPPLAAKPDFKGVPASLQRDLCTLVGAQNITRAATASGGISAAASFHLAFDNGAALFVKGSHPGDQSHGAANLRGECAAYQSLPLLRDIAPPYVGMVFVDNGDDNGWWLGAWQAIKVTAAPPEPAAAFALLDRVQLSDVTADGAVPLATAHPYLAQFFNATYKWQRVADDPRRAEKFAACFADTFTAAAWLRQNLPALLKLQSMGATQTYRLGLMHGDLRCDNFLYGALGTNASRWWLIDWANVAEGPLLFDRVMLAASLHAAGALSLRDAARYAQGDHPLADYHCMLASQAGYFADQLYRDVPAAMPALRDLQKAMFWALAALLTDAQIATPLPDFHSV